MITRENWYRFRFPKHEDIYILSGPYMWGFGQSFDKASPFSSNDARDEYMNHVRTCDGHHDPRGPRFSRCGAMNPGWFATDVVQGPE